jgi:replicative DNA helicase
MDLKRTMPESPAAEAGVLASMILNPDCIPDVIMQLQSSDAFYRKENKMIFEALLELYEKSMRSNPPLKINVITVSQELKRMGRFQDAGGLEYLQKVISLGKRKEYIKKQ